MTSSPNREIYWMQGASPVPYITAKKVRYVGMFGAVGLALLLLAGSTQSTGMLTLAMAALLCGVLVFIAMGKETSRGVATSISNRVRGALARLGRWDEFDPDVEVRPYWLRHVRVLSVTPGTATKRAELALLEEGDSYVAVLEVEGGGHGIHGDNGHVTREGAFSRALRNISLLEPSITHVEFVTRGVPAEDVDLNRRRPSPPWLTDALAESREQVREIAKQNSQQVRSWAVVRIDVRELDAKLRDDGHRVNEDSLTRAAFDAVGNITKELMACGIAVHGGLSRRRLAAVIRGMLLPHRSVDETTGIREFWDAWPGFRPSGRGNALMTADPVTEQQWFHASLSIPRIGWPPNPVYGRWLEPIVLTDRVAHRVVVTSFELMSPSRALKLARSQLTTASSRTIGERKKGKVMTGGTELEESVVQLVARDLDVRKAAGVRGTTRVLVSATSQRELARARSVTQSILTNDMGASVVWWDDHRQTVGVLRALPLGLGV